MTINIDYSKLDLPLRPGDTIYSVSEDDEQYKIFENRVASVVISQDNTMQFIIDSFVEEFGPEYRLFPTRTDAEKYVSELQSSLPRHTKPEDSITWYCPRIWRPATSMEVTLTLVPVNENGRKRRRNAFFVRDGEGILSEGFYIISPSAYDENFDIQVGRLDAENTKRIPDDLVFAWKDTDSAAVFVSKSLPLKL